jgi:hypothetical protein
MREHDVIQGTSLAEAKSEVEAKLRKQQLTKALTEKEMTAFCDAMVRNLELTSSKLSVVRNWAESWQAEWLGSSRVRAQGDRHS